MGIRGAAYGISGPVHGRLALAARVKDGVYSSVRPAPIPGRYFAVVAITSTPVG
jgi:hypothetical protein